MVEVTDDWQNTHTAYDLVVANLFANLIVEMSESLSRALSKTGILLCSGFFESDERNVRNSLERAGLIVCDRIVEDGWVALASESVG
jgi:ribosomal protein L11 methylase PrmA